MQALKFKEFISNIFAICLVSYIKQWDYIIVIRGSACDDQKETFFFWSSYMYF